MDHIPKYRLYVKIENVIFIDVRWQKSDVLNEIVLHHDLILAQTEVNL